MIIEILNGIASKAEWIDGFNWKIYQEMDNMINIEILY